MGFHFLLQPVYSQTWVLVREYLSYLKVEEAKSNTNVSWITAVSFLAKLSFLKPGEGYRISELSKQEERIMFDLWDFGLIYVRNYNKPKTARPVRYYPTQIVVSLFAPPSKRPGSQFNEGNLIVETNFRVYVYQSSSLQIAILKLFVQLLLRLPGLVVGVLTRESIQQAINKGISSEQIITYLRSNSHPKAREAVIDGVPESVVEQVELWANEQHRVRFTPNVVLFSPPTDEDFRAILSHCKEDGSLVYAKDRTDHEGRFIVALETCEEHIKRLLRPAGIRL